MFEEWWEEPRRKHRIKRECPPLPSRDDGKRSRQTLFNTVRRRVAHHELARIIKMGCVVDKDIDIPVKCSEVYGGFWWNFLRAAVLYRDRHRCRMCGAEGCDVHHIRPRWLGGIDHPFNLITLCPKCHRAEHRRRICEKASNDRNQTTLDGLLALKAESEKYRRI